jgi:hypothetical protein
MDVGFDSIGAGFGTSPTTVGTSVLMMFPLDCCFAA